MRSTCAIARIVMIWWDQQFLDLCAKSNLILEDKQRYMDDIRVWCAEVRLGWRWVEGDLVFCMEWRREDEAAGMSGLEKTIQIMKDIMNCICRFLRLTMESALDFDGVLPTLDLGEEN